jgi:hypothetical protein
MQSPTGGHSSGRPFFYENRYQVAMRMPRPCRKRIYGHQKIHVSVRERGLGIILK